MITKAFNGTKGDGNYKRHYLVTHKGLKLTGCQFFSAETVAKFHCCGVQNLAADLTHVDSAQI